MKTNNITQRSNWVLPIIIFSQFCCTSTWFAGNSIVDELKIAYNLSDQSLGDISSAVQFGFILGTFVFAVLTLSDRFSPSKIFFVCATIGAVFNFGLLYNDNTMSTILSFRFFTGFTLAGIYPVGMKIAADHYKKGLGKSLSLLVGALVLGKSFPHLIKSFDYTLQWETVIYATSMMSVIGGILILFVSNGPYQKLAKKFDATKIIKVFKNSSLRSAAFGYFGHMWELYAFWTFLPVFLLGFSEFHQTQINIYFISFLVIAVGAMGCVLGGLLSNKYGTKKIASLSIGISGMCCVLSPLFFILGYQQIFIIFLLIWGMAVIADSPLFSTMVAHSAQPESKGTALTIVNCIGFAITIISIQLLNTIFSPNHNVAFAFLILAIGPVLGLLGLRLNHSTTKSK
ncbi:MFS transporter [Winogradskyella ursingii]|uniref:MFS transporter n=1 Tax=Winogradskyella ursingii TaxID=2686079 RepID=UPI001C53EB6A|nr:MFS transporter [Winogradskyella ursingii]